MSWQSKKGNKGVVPLGISQKVVSELKIEGEILGNVQRNKGGPLGQLGRHRVKGKGRKNEGL